jgi:hypothetical protein
MTIKCTVPNITIGSADKALGNREGWKEFDAKPLERGVATHIYAAFDPALKGMLFMD